MNNLICFYAENSITQVSSTELQIERCISQLTTTMGVIVNFLFRKYYLYTVETGCMSSRSVLLNNMYGFTTVWRNSIKNAKQQGCYSLCFTIYTFF